MLNSFNGICVQIVSKNHYNVQMRYQKRSYRKIQ